MSINCIPCMTCTMEAGIKNWVLKLDLKEKRNTSVNLSSSWV